MRTLSAAIVHCGPRRRPRCWPARGAPQQASADSATEEGAESPDPLPRRGFNVVLLVGDMQGRRLSGARFRSAARKALSDMQDFLPYKGYNLLDTQWMVGGTSSPAVTRLRGLDEQEYELELRASPTMLPGTGALDRTGISVRFVLRDVDTGDGSVERGVLPAEGAGEGRSGTLRRSAARLFQLERERDDLELVGGERPGRCRGRDGESGSK